MVITKKKLRRIIETTVDANIDRMEGMKFLKNGFKTNQTFLKERLLRELKLKKEDYGR